jgi:hypothetical protein
MCGRKFNSDPVRDLLAALTQLVQTGESYHEDDRAFDIVTVHLCADDYAGVAELIGGEKAR